MDITILCAHSADTFIQKTSSECRRDYKGVDRWSYNLTFTLSCPPCNGNIIPAGTILQIELETSDKGCNAYFGFEWELEYTADLLGSSGEGQGGELVS